MTILNELQAQKQKNYNKMKNLLTVVLVTKSITISDTKKMLEKRF